MTAFDLTPPTDAQRTALIAGLSEDERRVLLQHGTEAPFCGVFLDNKQDGVYTCRLCGLPLFRSSAKFDSGTGWRASSSRWTRRTSAASATRATAWSAPRSCARAATATWAMCFRTGRPRPANATA